jgi:hypothetical protein
VIAFALTLLVVLAFVVGLLLGFAMGLRRTTARRTSAGGPLGRSRGIDLGSERH